MTSQTNELAALVASGRASFEDMNALGAARVAEVKTHPGVLQVRGAKAQAPLSVNEEKRTISYLVSDETPDRMGDVIRVKGWDYTAYKRNPVVLWSHDGKTVPPIGKAMNVRRRYGPARLTADIEFAPKEAFEFADTIYQLATRGFIRATSVGFIPTATEEVDEKKREKLGLGQFGQLYTGTELMEISVVAVPANPSALQDGVKALSSEGLLDDGKVARFFDTFPATEDDALARVRAACRSFVDFGSKLAEETEIEEKSPACRMDDESEEDCVSRKVPELIEEGMSDEQAVAVAHSVCETSCSDEYKSDARLVEAMATLIEQQAEQTRATRQLVDSLSDLTARLHNGGADGGSVHEPDAKAPDAVQERGEDVSLLVDRAVRGFAERIGRDILTQ
tara:strand:+ start:198 stop:1379 length:1182 start_codon:yes stop_codon:yes gene_type:complete